MLTKRLAPQETRTYFVTSVTAQRRRLFQVTSTAELLQQTILDYHRQGKFLLHAFVIMPDHLHALITPASEVSQGGCGKTGKEWRIVKENRPSAAKATDVFLRLRHG